MTESTILTRDPNTILAKNNLRCLNESYLVKKRDKTLDFELDRISRLENVDIVNFSSDYISDFMGDVLSGVVHLRSPKDTGKTTYIKKICDNYDYVLYITNRVSLIEDVCTRLGFTSYLEQEILSNARKIACTIHSLANLPPEFRASLVNGTGLVIVDESCNVAKEITLSTILKNRKFIVEIFNNLISLCHTVAFADSDTDAAIVEYSSRVGDRKVTVFNNTVKKKRSKLSLRKYQGAFPGVRIQSYVLGELAKEKRIIIFGDSKAELQELSEKIHDKYPKSNILEINSDTITNNLVIEFLANPNLAIEKHQYDVILCSPTICAGLSIDIRGYFHLVVGIYSEHTLNAREIRQQLRRIRDIIPVTVFVTSPNFKHKQNNETAIKQNVLKKLLRDLANHADVVEFHNMYNARTGSCSLTEWGALLVDLYSRYLAYENRCMTNLYAVLRYELAKEYDLTEGSDTEKVTKEEVINLVGEEFYQESRAIKTEKKAQKKEIFSNAPVPTIEQYREIAKKKRLSPVEKASKYKFEICRDFSISAEQLTDKIIRTHKRISGNIDLIKIAFNPTELNTATKSAIRDGLYFMDHPQYSGIEYLFEKMGLTSFISLLSSHYDSDELIDRQTLIEFGKRIIYHQEELREYGIKFSINEEDKRSSSILEIKYVNSFFATFGIEFDSKLTRIKGSSEREYKYLVNRETWEAVQNLISSGK